LIDDIVGDFRFDSTSELRTFDTLLTGEFGEAGGGPIGVALGLQIRDAEISYDYDPNSNADNFLFFNGTPDFAGSRDVTALFIELGLPLSDTLDMQLAARHEDYGGGLDSSDPKLSLLWRPIDSVSLRASIGSSFRAPSIFQEFGVQTSLAQLIDPMVGIPQFFPVRTDAEIGAPRLKPEEADALNLGVSWSVSERLEFAIDYWHFDYSQVIIQQNPQALLNAAAGGNAEAQAQVIRDPTSGLLLRIDSFYANASSLETDGFDLLLNYELPLAGGSILSFGADATLMTSYDLVDPQAGAIDGLGRRNFTNFATSAPELRTTLFAGWQRDSHGLNVYLRHIDAYRDDQAPAGSAQADIDSFLSADAQYSFVWDRPDHSLSFAVGAINLLDEDPPRVATNGGYDSKVHDPRGRLLYARAAVSF
jgi:outer membrane receptor protein involved in Fe transport